MWKEKEKEVVILESVERINLDWFSWMAIINLILYVSCFEAIKGK